MHQQSLSEERVVQTALNRIGLGALAVMIAWPAAPSQALTARVTPVSGLAPSDIVIRAFIEPSALNHSLSVVVDSDAFYTSSETELEGDQAPRVKEVRFRRLPAGSYKVHVILFGTDGPRGESVLFVELL
jgi:hypothetical protein